MCGQVDAGGTGMDSISSAATRAVLHPSDLIRLRQLLRTNDNEILQADLFHEFELSLTAASLLATGCTQTRTPRLKRRHLIQFRRGLDDIRVGVYPVDLLISVPN